jgi:hypothetical protein
VKEIQRNKEALALLEVKLLEHLENVKTEVLCCAYTLRRLIMHGQYEVKTTPVIIYLRANSSSPFFSLEKPCFRSAFSISVDCVLVTLIVSAS